MKRGPRQDKFSELLADGLPPTEAGRAMGMRPDAANAMMQRIRRRLGAQAV